MRPSALLLLSCLAAVGCRRTPPAEKQAAAPAPLPAAADGRCRSVPNRSYPTPETAYAAYAEAINQAHWCEALATFEPTSMPRVVLSNFKSLAALAGSAHPKQREYALALAQLCQRHGLDCADANWLPGYVAVANNPSAAQSQLARVSTRAQVAPQALYVDIMDALQSVDRSALAQLDVSLTQVQPRGLMAVGMAQRVGGKPFQLTFVHKDTGWQLLMPN